MTDMKLEDKIYIYRLKIDYITMQCAIFFKTMAEYKSQQRGTAKWKSIPCRPIQAPEFSCPSISCPSTSCPSFSYPSFSAPPLLQATNYPPAIIQFNIQQRHVSTLHNDPRGNKYRDSCNSQIRRNTSLCTNTF